MGSNQKVRYVWLLAFRLSPTNTFYYLMTPLLAVIADDSPSFADWQSRIHAFLDDHVMHDRVVTVYYQSALRTDSLSPPIRWLMPGETLPSIDTTTLLIERADDELMVIHVGGPEISLATIENSLTSTYA